MLLISTTIELSFRSGNAEADRLAGARVAPFSCGQFLKGRTQRALHQALAQLAHARLKVQRTRLVSPVNGYVTNLNVQVGDYATAGQSVIAIVDADNFWVDGYFEETFLDEIHPGAPARVKLMGSKVILQGHVVNVARGISVPMLLDEPPFTALHAVSQLLPSQSYCWGQ
jgi:multidrug resistance efflux pump